MMTGKLSVSEVPLDAVEEPALVLLRDYWREAARGRPCLPSAELRPEHFVRALEHIAIVERVETPRRGHRIRLCGADMENKDFGIVRGAFLEDARPPWYRDHVAGEIARAIERSQPVCQRVTAEIDKQTFAFTRLMLPLTRGGGACDTLLVASVRPSNEIVAAIRARLPPA